MRIWVTRTEPGASRLAAALRAAGHTVWVRPTLDIECLAAPPPPGEFALTVFLSEHAVAGAFANGWTPGPAMAIGTATAAALRVHGVCPLLPAAATSEGVIARLADMAQGTPDGETAAAARAPNAEGAATPAKRLPESVLIAAGEGGREVLLAWLAERGTRAVKWPVYRRVVRQGVVPADTAIDAIVVGSVAGLQAAANLWFASRRSPATAVVTPSQRVADAARQLGFSRVLTAAGADAAATLAALCQTPSEERI